MNDDKSTQLLQTSRKLYSILIPPDHITPSANIVEIKYLNSKTDANFFQNYDTTPHRHAYFELHLVTSGLQTYQINDVLYPVENGALLLIPPGMRHAIPYSTNVIEKFAISFFQDGDEDPAWAWVWDILNAPSPLFIPSDANFLSMFQIIMSIANEEKKGWVEAIRNLVSVMICLLAQQQNPKSDVHPATYFDPALRIRSLEQFIRDNLDLPLSASILANHLHISCRQLNRNVKQVRGVTLQKFVETIKFDVACQMLSDPAYSIPDICKRLGILDESSFSRFFKRISGVPPIRWRKQHLHMDERSIPHD